MKLIVKNTRQLSPLDPEDTSVSEAIYTLYKNSENPIVDLVWGGFIIPIDGITLSHIYFDVGKMVARLKSNEESFKIFFLDSALTAEWQFEVRGNSIEITALWTTVRGYGHTDNSIENLRASNFEVIDKSSFVSDWNSLLLLIKNDLITAGYDSSLQDFEYLT